MIDPRETVVSIARELGISPWQALSVWQQESGGSTDTSLLGKPLSRNRGNAVGPWQVVPAYHPNFPVGGSFEDQTRYALGYLKDVGPAGYYGTGKPPPGDPTSDQYVAQVNARAAQLAQAGRPDIQQGLFAEAKPMAGQQAPQPMSPQQQMMPPMGMPQMQPPGFWDKLTGSPAFNMGLGILASNTGNYGAAAPAIGRGALLGMQNAGSLQEGRAEQMYRQMQMQQAQMKYQKDLQDAAKVDAWVATLSPEDQQLAGIIGADKLAQFKLEQQKGPTPTDDMREYQKAVEQGFSGTLMDYQTKMKQAGASNVNVSVGGDKKYVEKRGELDATEMARLQSSASGAYRNNFALERVLTSSDAAAAGGAAMLQTGIKNVLASFGYTDAELQSSQQLQQAVAEIKAGKMAELGARGLTDKDMEILTQSLPRLDSDPNARKAIASILMRANEATIDEYADAVRWEDEQYPEQKFRRPSWLKNRNKPIIEDGFRYKGPMPPTVTDKANPANWEKL